MILVKAFVTNWFVCYQSRFLLRQALPAGSFAI
jgi:hypothetical protein